MSSTDFSKKVARLLAVNGYSQAGSMSTPVDDIDAGRFETSRKSAGSAEQVYSTNIGMPPFLI